MERISSFCVDHNALQPGIYLSHEDTTPSGDVISTYDIRMRAPNHDPVMSITSAHSIEHLGATFLRNHADWSKKTIYFWPMWCRTGMYVLFSWEPGGDEVVKIIKEMYTWIAELDDSYTIPGATAAECGNYLDHSLSQAKNDAQKFLEIIKDNNSLWKYSYL